MEVQRPNDGSDCNGSLPTHAETSLDRCEEHAMDVIDGFSVNGGGPVLEDSNATKFHKPHGELSFSTTQAYQSSQGIEGEGYGNDASQRGIDAD